MDKWIVTYNEKVTMMNDGWQMTEMDNDKFAFFHPSDREGAEMFARVIIREGGAAQLARFKPQPLMMVAW